MVNRYTTYLLAYKGISRFLEGKTKRFYFIFPSFSSMDSVYDFFLRFALEHGKTRAVSNEEFSCLMIMIGN